MLNFWKQSKDAKTTEVDPKSPKAALFAGCPVPAFAKDSGVIVRLESISGERNALNEARKRTLETIEMPRSRSISIQSLTACARAFLALTAPASWIAPP